MSNYWWRAYNEAVDDPKLILLSDKAHRAWFNLMCVAAANSGVLPEIKVIAVKLRITPHQASSAIAELVQAGLIDKREDGRFEPHNWNGRQYKSDVSTERVKRFRKREGNVSCNVSCNVSGNVSETSSETEDRIQIQNVADAGDARARAGGLSGPEALNLAERLLVIAGHDPKFWPPGWCGAPMRVQMWLDQGWKPEIIIAAVTSGAARKRGEPANSVQFFERTIAEEHARQAAPLPKVEIRQAETITVTHGTSKPRSGGSLIDSINRERALVEAQIADLEMSGDAILSIPDRSVRRS